MSGRNLHPGYLLRAPAEELDAWRDAAAEAGETLSQWLREAARQRRGMRAAEREWTETNRETAAPECKHEVVIRGHHSDFCTECGQDVPVTRATPATDGGSQICGACKGTGNDRTERCWGCYGTGRSR